jgi:hypothetical protein
MGFSGGLGLLDIDVFIQDVPASTILFRNRQFSFNITSANFVVGGSAGNLTNVNIGTLTGVLPAGSYRYRYQWTLQDRLTDSNQLTGTGNLLLTLQPQGSASSSAAAPEPSTLALLVLGAAGLALGRRRRARA